MTVLKILVLGVFQVARKRLNEGGKTYYRGRTVRRNVFVGSKDG